MRARDLTVLGAKVLAPLAVLNHGPRAGGEHDFDAVAAIQTGARPSDVTSVCYTLTADGTVARSAAATHADIVAVAGAAARAMSLTSADVVAVTAPLTSQFGFAAGFAAANGAHAKIGVWLSVLKKHVNGRWRMPGSLHAYC